MQLNIQCLHETGQVEDTGVEVSNYHPLTKDEVAELLKLARETKDVRKLFQIQVRLGQGIIGAVCPHPLEGMFAEKSAQLDSLYVAERMKGDDPELVERFYQIMTS